MSKSLDEMFDHPCKQTCSGWQQAYEKGSRQANMEISNMEDKLYHTSRKIDELNYELGHEIKALKAKLQIAVDALTDTTFSVDRRTSGIAKGALKQITEVEGEK
jgi:hypothetical protein